MYKDIQLKPPIFELGLKGYLYGQEAVKLARQADRISAAYDVRIIYSPPYVDIPAVAAATEHLLVFAQHMDPVRPGRGLGAVLPESIKAAGAVGTLLNHAERPLQLSHIASTIERADDVGLATLVCADTPTQAAAIAQLGPNMILAEPPELIGTSDSVGSRIQSFIINSIKQVRNINPDIIVFNSAGIRTPQDVAQIIELGGHATGATSGVLLAPDPATMLEAMIAAMKEAWLRR